MLLKQQRVARYVVGMNLHGKLGVLASRKDAERGAFWTNRPGLQEFVGRPRHSKHWSSDREGHRPLTAQQDAVFLLGQVIRPTPGRSAPFYDDSSCGKTAIKRTTWGDATIWMVAIGKFARPGPRAVGSGSLARHLTARAVRVASSLMDKLPHRGQRLPSATVLSHSATHHGSRFGCVLVHARHVQSPFVLEHVGRRASASRAMAGQSRCPPRLSPARSPASVPNA